MLNWSWTLVVTFIMQDTYTIWRALQMKVGVDYLSSLSTNRQLLWVRSVSWISLPLHQIYLSLGLRGRFPSRSLQLVPRMKIAAKKSNLTHTPGSFLCYFYKLCHWEYNTIQTQKIILCNKLVKAFIHCITDMRQMTPSVSTKVHWRKCKTFVI